MKFRPILLTSIAVLLAACDQSTKQEAQRLADERAALEREKAELASQKNAAQQAAIDEERARLEAERARLESEKARLSSDRETQIEADRKAQVAAEKERRLAAERMAADQTAARQEAEMREREARLNAEQAEQRAQDNRSAQTVDFFYDALDPYGDWVQVDGYGYAFRPKLGRDPGWRPYTDGGWVYTDYGWTWRSDEPFGWATYHYGRWARAPRLGWIWVPGTEWGPAWVSWRKSDDYVGWAPLPPDAWSSSGFNAGVDSYYDIGPGMYAFVRTGDFGESTYRGRVVAPEQNVTIIRNTVNVTKVIYQNIQNKVVVVNNGPDLNVINRVSRRPVQRLEVDRIATGAPQPTRVDGNVLRIAAPDFRGGPKPGGKPKAVRDEIKGQDFDRGWRDAKNDEKGLRDEARQEARKAEDAQRIPGSALPPKGGPARPPQATPNPERPLPLPTPLKPLSPRPNQNKPPTEPELTRPTTPPPAAATPPRRPNQPKPPTASELNRPGAPGSEGLAPAEATPSRRPNPGAFRSPAPEAKPEKLAPPPTLPPAPRNLPTPQLDRPEVPPRPAKPLPNESVTPPRPRKNDLLPPGVKPEPARPPESVAPVQPFRRPAGELKPSTEPKGAELQPAQGNEGVIPKDKDKEKEKKEKKER